MPLKEMTLAVLASWPALVMPHKVDPVDPRLSPTPRTRRLDDQAGEAEPVDLECKKAGGDQQCAAGRAGTHAPEHGDLGAGAVGDASGPGTAGEGGNVLDADDETCQRCTVAHAEVHIRRQYGQRQTIPTDRPQK
jgi:hypothetical protein